ncbi:MAG: hypothetical protein GVY08_08495 [Bacteroidetes bacterium]|nr:hypothetical protein [Bacteroidota bacterium]
MLLAGFGLVGCEFNQLSEDEQTDQLMLVPKQQTTGQKAKATSNQQTTPYSCLISTLADDDAEYNYWNQAFWVHFPKPAVEQAKGKTIFKAFSFASEHAGDKAGSWAGKDKIVRVAQCEIPDSKLAETLLEEQLKKFGKGTWLESHKANQERSSQNEAQAKSSSDWDWECSEYFITVVCQVDSQSGELTNCVITDIRCVSYELVYNEPPGGGGGGGGFPGDDPGECDPQGTDPCFEDGGGGSIPPPEPDPCEEDNAPAYCENPCETGDPILDDEGIQIGFENMWEDSNYGNDSNPNPESQRQEQVGFIVPNGFGGYQLQRLSSSFISDAGPCAVSFKAPGNLPEGTILVHTHPYSKGESQNQCIPGQTLKYDNVPGVEDRPTLNTLGLDEGIILDSDKVIRFTSNASEQPTLINRCGY